MTWLWDANKRHKTKSLAVTITREANRHLVRWQTEGEEGKEHPLTRDRMSTTKQERKQHGKPQPWGLFP